MNRFLAWATGSSVGDRRMPEAGHPLIMLAVEAIDTFLSHQRIVEPPQSLFIQAPEALKPAGVFVCLKHGADLRGCIGTTEPAYETMAQEVIHNAIGAATRDPRFPPVRRFELDALVISVDVLGPSEPAPHPSMLDHRRFGIIVRSGDRHSVLLPDIEGIRSVAEQLAIAREKAGLDADEPVEVLRFEVTRYR